MRKEASSRQKSRFDDTVKAHREKSLGKEKSVKMKKNASNKNTLAKVEIPDKKGIDSEEEEKEEEKKPVVK